MRNINLFIGLLAMLLTYGQQTILAQQSGDCAHDSPLYGERILLIGDSQTKGHFGQQLAYQLVNCGVDYFYREGRIGWGVDDWWRERIAIKKLIRFSKPDIILIELGGNDMGIVDRIDYEHQVKIFWEFIHRHKLNNSKVLWVAPARTVGKAKNKQPARDEVARIILQQIGEEHYIESRDITGDFGRTPDGLHFTPRGGQQWAEKLIPRIEEKIKD